MSPKAKGELAREHLDRALPAVTAEDYTEAVTWLFAALEAAIVAVAERDGIDTKKRHWEKAKAAQRLHDSGVLPHDFSQVHDILNNARKVAVYEGEEPRTRRAFPRRRSRGGRGCGRAGGAGGCAVTEAIAPQSAHAWTNDGAWHRSLEAAALRVESCLPAKFHDLHGTLVRRARSAGARALILSGSTARGRRTDVSDLDYHLIGPGVETRDLSRELDLHVLSEQKLRSEILAGDDFVQWSVRFGCIVFDDGTVRRALRLITERQPWPSVERKREHAVKSLDLARRFVGTGDEDGAVEQVRTALSLAARARLLGVGVFPLSRAELPGQLEGIGCMKAAHCLAATIYDSPPLSKLAEAVSHGEDLLARRDALTELGAAERTR